jgi:hypothetical protein
MLMPGSWSLLGATPRHRRSSAISACRRSGFSAPKKCQCGLYDALPVACVEVVDAPQALQRILSREALRGRQEARRRAVAVGVYTPGEDR